MAAAIEAECSCESAAHHGGHVRCVAKMVKHAGVPRRCRKAIVRCAAKSMCGRQGVPCIKPNGKCVIDKSADHCEAHGGTVGEGDSCCPACPTTTQCCVPTSAGGAFDSTMGAFLCRVLTSDECTAQNGIDEGPGTCSPDPCPTGGSSSTTLTTTTTMVTTTTAMASTIQCCVASSNAGAFTRKHGPTGATCVVTTAADCQTRNGVDVGPGTCSPNACTTGSPAGAFF